MPLTLVLDQLLHVKLDLINLLSKLVLFNLEHFTLLQSLIPLLSANFRQLEVALFGQLLELLMKCFSSACVSLYLSSA